MGKGERVCVGILHSGEKTRWMMKRAERCDIGGFSHYFGFNAMRDDYRSPLAPACILAAEAKGRGGAIVRRLALAAECANRMPTPGFSAWNRSRELTFLSERRADTDIRICSAESDNEEGLSHSNATNSTRGQLFRVFEGDDCERRKITAELPDGGSVQWTVSPGPSLFTAKDASGVHMCLCQKERAFKRKSKKTLGVYHYYSWGEGECRGKNAKKELCIYDLSASDALRYAHLIDEVT